MSYVPAVNVAAKLGCDTCGAERPEAACENWYVVVRVSERDRLTACLRAYCCPSHIPNYQDRWVRLIPPKGWVRDVDDNEYEVLESNEHGYAQIRRVATHSAPTDALTSGSEGESIALTEAPVRQESEAAPTSESGPPSEPASSGTDWRGIHNDEGAELLREVVRRQDEPFDQVLWDRIAAWAADGENQENAPEADPMDSSRHHIWKPGSHDQMDYCTRCGADQDSAKGRLWCPGVSQAVDVAPSSHDVGKNAMADRIDVTCGYEWGRSLEHAGPHRCGVLASHREPHVCMGPTCHATESDDPLLSQGTLNHLRSLPTGSLTQAEVEILCDEIARLRTARDSAPTADCGHCRMIEVMQASPSCPVHGVNAPGWSYEASDSNDTSQPDGGRTDG